MAISYVGGKAAGRTNASAALSVALSGFAGGSGGVPLEGDLVVVTVSVGTAARQPAINVTTPTGYTPLTVQRTTATTYDSNVQTSYKVMGATPDTTVTVPGSGNNADGLGYAIQVFRGVDITTPMDATATYATGSGTDNRPDPAAITPVTAGAWIVCCGGGAAATGTTLLTAAALTNVLSANGADTNDGTVGVGYYTGWTSGSYDPAVFGGGSVNENNSWGATTLALRPAAEPVNGDASGGLSSSSLTAPTTSATGGASASGSLSEITQTAPTASATGSAGASGALGTVTLTAPTGSAEGVTPVNADATGSLSSVTLTAATASATGGAEATGTLPAVTQTAPTATATGAATGAGALATATLTAPAGSASGSEVVNGNATGALATTTLTAPTSAATGTAAASGALQGINLTAPTGSASGASVVNGNASASLTSISLTAATAQAVADAQAEAVFASLQINPATGAAYGTATASGLLAGIVLTGITATARGTDPSVPEPGKKVQRAGRASSGMSRPEILGTDRAAQLGGTRYTTANTTRPARDARTTR